MNVRVLLWIVRKTLFTSMYLYIPHTSMYKDVPSVLTCKGYALIFCELQVITVSAVLAISVLQRWTSVSPRWFSQVSQVRILSFHSSELEIKSGFHLCSGTSSSDDRWRYTYSCDGVNDLHSPSILTWMQNQQVRLWSDILKNLWLQLAEGPQSYRKIYHHLTCAIWH